MAESKSKPRRKARQSSIYRKLEALLCEMMLMTERLPKNANGLQAVGVRVVNETLEALSTTEFAIHSSDMNARIAYIAALIHSMTIVKTCCRELYGFSRKDRIEPKVGKDGKVVTNGQGDAVFVKSPLYGRVISNAQYATLLELFSEIGKEVMRWYNVTLSKMSQNNVSAR